MSHTAVHSGSVSVRDLLALTKPRITSFALITAAGGLALAPGSAAPSVWFALLFGTALIVGAANTLNMYLERELDCRMARTKKRPLPDGRLSPEVALVFGVLLASVSVPFLTFAVHPLPALLGVIALVSYVMLYTPLKQRTPVSLLVGSVPGAMPVLIGWSAGSHTIDLPGLCLFGVLFLWQVPHFHAIAIFRRKDYERAGYKVLPTQRGEETTRHAILFYLAAQIQLSLLLVPLGVAGRWYLAAAVLLGGVYFSYALFGVIRRLGPRWARNLFFLSLIYLPALFTVLIIDGV